MPLSAAAIRELTKREGGDPVILLLTIEHDDWAEPVRFCTNTIGDDIVSNGETFTAAPFELEWPTDDDKAPVSRLKAFNVDRLLGTALDELVTPCTCTLQAVLASDPDTIQRQALKFELRNTQWDGAFLTGEISQARYGTEPWPAYRVTPNKFPALFR